MRLPIACPACAAKLQVSDKMLGHKITCPMCGQRVVLASEPPAPPRRTHAASESLVPSRRIGPIALIAAGASAVLVLVGVITIAALRVEEPVANPSDARAPEPPAVAAVAERKDNETLDKKFESLEKEIEALQKKNEALEKSNEFIKKENEAILQEEELLKRKIESAPTNSGRERPVPIPKVKRTVDRPTSGLSITELDSATRLKPQLPCMLWADAKGSAFLMLEAGAGVVRRVSFPEMKVTKQQDFDRPFGWMSLSAQGLVFTSANENQIWLVDPVTLALKTKIDVPQLGRAGSIPSLSVAICSDRLFTPTLYVVDLAKKTVTRGWTDAAWKQTSREFRISPKKNPGDSAPWPHYASGGGAPALENPVLSPNGVFVFTENNNPGGGMARFLLDNGRLRFKGYSWGNDYLSNNSRAVSAGITFSPDSKLVCRADFDGSMRGGPGSGTPIYGVTDDFANHTCILPIRPAPKALGFDGKASVLYVQNAKKGLAVYSLHGVEKEEFAPTPKLDVVIQYLVHPDGGRFAALTSGGVFRVDLPKRP